MSDADPDARLSPITNRSSEEIESNDATEERLWEQVYDLEMSIGSARRSAAYSRRQYWFAYCSIAVTLSAVTLLIAATFFKAQTSALSLFQIDWLFLLTVFSAVLTVVVAIWMYSTSRDVARLQDEIRAADDAISRARLVLDDDDLNGPPENISSRVSS